MAVPLQPVSSALGVSSRRTPTATPPVSLTLMRRLPSARKRPGNPRASPSKSNPRAPLNFASALPDRMEVKHSDALIGKSICSTPERSRSASAKTRYSGEHPPLTFFSLPSSSDAGGYFVSSSRLRSVHGRRPTGGESSGIMHHRHHASCSAGDLRILHLADVGNSYQRASATNAPSWPVGVIHPAARDRAVAL